MRRSAYDSAVAQMRAENRTKIMAEAEKAERAAREKLGRKQIKAENAAKAKVAEEMAKEIREIEAKAAAAEAAGVELPQEEITVRVGPVW